MTSPFAPHPPAPGGQQGPRLLFVDAYPYTEGGGAHRVVARLSAGLVHRGWSVTALLPDRGVGEAWLRQAGVDVVVEPAPAALLDYGGTTSVPRALSRLPGYWRRLRPLMQEADVVWASDLRGLLLAGPAARSTRTPLVWHVHARPSAPRVAGAVLSRLADHVVTPSASLAAMLALTDRAVVMPNPVDAVDPAPSDQVVPRRLLTTARLHPDKGLDVLLEATARLRTQRLELEVRVLGGAQPGHEAYPAELLATATRLGIADLLTLVGHVDAVGAELAAAAVYVQPSRSESFGLATLEAMAAGRPVIVSDAGGLPELVGADAGLVVPTGDPDALAGAIQRLVEDPGLRERMGAAARRRSATSYSPAAFLDRAEALARSAARVEP